MQGCAKVGEWFLEAALLLNSKSAVDVGDV